MDKEREIWRKIKSEVIDEARTKGHIVHFVPLMDFCHLKNSVDSGSYAVSGEQGSSASQMTAAKVMDIISMLHGCSGQAADAVSAYTQVKMEDAPSSLKIPKSECPDILIRLPRQMAKIMVQHGRSSRSS